MRFNNCDLCGKALTETEYIYDIHDSRDKYRRYHHKIWQVCDECHEELTARREEVLETLLKKAESEGTTTSDATLNMTEF